MSSESGPPCRMIIGREENEEGVYLVMTSLSSP
jgi:hypothetical protein